MTPAELAGALWRALAIGGAILAVSIAMLREPGSSIRSGPAVALGLALWFAPPALLSLTPKYQMELGPGRGYLPVLVQVFGVALLFACCLRALLRAAAARSRAAAIATIGLASFGAAFVGGVTAFNNFRVLGIQQPERAVRSLLEAGAARGVFSGVPAGSSVLFWDRDVEWSTAVPLFGVPWVELMLADRTDRRYDARVESLRAPDQSIVFSRVLKSGEVYQVPAKSGLSLRTGNAGALEIAVDGKPAPSIGGLGTDVGGCRLAAPEGRRRLGSVRGSPRPRPGAFGQQPRRPARVGGG